MHGVWHGIPGHAAAVFVVGVMVGITRVTQAAPRNTKQRITVDLSAARYRGFEIDFPLLGS